jgi:hypothetical protein
VKKPEAPKMVELPVVEAPKVLEAVPEVEDKSVAGQVRLAFRKENRLELCLGALGGVMPTIGFAVGHFGTDVSGIIAGQVVLTNQVLVMLAIVLGTLTFSAKTVAVWMAQGFGGDWWKAIGFVVGVEGAMMTAPHNLMWLSSGLFGMLVAINWIATACGFISGKKG